MTFNANTGYTGKIGTLNSSTTILSRFRNDCTCCKSVDNRARTKNEIWFQDLGINYFHLKQLYLSKFRWNINVAYQKALRKLQTTLDVPFVEMNLNTITYETKLYLPSDDKSEYIIGLQGMLQNNRNLNDRASQFLPDANINNIGLLGLVQYTFFEKLKLQGGLRFDMYKQNCIRNRRDKWLSCTVNKEFSSMSNGATYGE